MGTKKNDRDARTLAVETVLKALSGPAYADDIVKEVLQKSGLSARDKGLYVEIVNGTIRRKRSLDHILSSLLHKGLESLPPRLLVILEVSLYQLRYLDRLPDYAVISEAVHIAKEQQGKSQSRLVNGVLRNYLRKKKYFDREFEEHQSIESIALQHSHPDWIVKLWWHQFSSRETELICEHNNRRPSVHLRVNLKLIDTEAYLTKLSQAGIEAKRSEFFQDFILLISRHPVDTLPGYTEGWFAVQDESTALASLLLNPDETDTVVDLCAAPGGKSCHLAALAGGKSRIISVDSNELRLHRLLENIYRLRISNVMPIVADGTKIHFKHVDKVIIDAPCSGLGVLARRVDLRWKRKERELRTFCRMQTSLLDNAAGLLGSGGILVYSTCTLNYGENEVVIDQFLNKHPEFNVQEGQDFLKPFLGSQGFYQTVPFKHDMDGMFAVRMKKR